MLTVDYVSRDAAIYACLHYHYLRSVPVGKLVCIGAWEDGQYIGAVVFARGANRNIGKPYGLGQHEVCELVRVALREHKCYVSQIISRALRLLKQCCPGIKLVVSYADTEHGHHGGIYQASNWIYLGTTNPERHVVVGGKRIHKRQSHSLYRSSRPRGARYVVTPPKHRYVYPLDKRLRKQLLPMAKEYPRRIEDSVSV